VRCSCAWTGWCLTVPTGHVWANCDAVTCRARLGEWHGHYSTAREAELPLGRRLPYIVSCGTAAQQAHMGAVAVFLSSLGLPRCGAVRGVDHRCADVEAVACGRFCAPRCADRSTSTRMLRWGMARRRWGGVLKAQAAITAGRRRTSEPRCWDGKHRAASTLGSTEYSQGEDLDVLYESRESAAKDHARAAQSTGARSRCDQYSAGDCKLLKTSCCLPLSSERSLQDTAPGC